MINPNTTNNVSIPTSGVNACVNFVQQGDGEAVIMIHGLAASLFDWVDLMPDLAKTNLHGYALDLLGHGLSYKPARLNEYTVANLFNHFCDWVGSLDLEGPAILVGHSLGGYIALEYAKRFPSKVKALILVDPFYNLEQLPRLLRLNYRNPFLTTTIIELTPEWFFRKLIDLTSLSIRNGYVLPESVRVQTASDYKRAHPGIFNIIHSMQDFTPYFQQISQPALIVWGENDQTLAPASFSTMVKHISGARGYVIRGAGHVPHQSHAAEFNQVVLEFINNLTSVPGE